MTDRRPHPTNPGDVGGFLREGFGNIVLWGPNLWPNTGDLSLEDKIAGLERVARDPGVTPQTRL